MCRLFTKHNLSSTDLPYFAPNFEHVVVIYPSGNIPENLRDFNTHKSLRKLSNFSNRMEAIPKAIMLQPAFRTKKEYNLHRILRATNNTLHQTLLKTIHVAKRKHLFQKISS
jgi:hypothetical protein